MTTDYPHQTDTALLDWTFDTLPLAFYGELLEALDAIASRNGVSLVMHQGTGSRSVYVRALPITPPPSAAA